MKKETLIKMPQTELVEHAHGLEKKVNALQSLKERNENLRGSYKDLQRDYDTRHEQYLAICGKYANQTLNYVTLAKKTGWLIIGSIVYLIGSLALIIRLMFF